MAIVSAEKFVQAARENGYAVGGFNTKQLRVDSSNLACSRS
ncbi:fructose-bisphosphate aldolase [Streptococcus pyogenes]|nr:fructose-bisphosphate aldolase [Streptococcus pyogenes]